MTDKGLAVGLTAAAGGLIALQAPINSGLGKHVGTFAAAAISFLVGTVTLVVIAAIVGNANLAGAAHLPWYSFAGGLLGAGYVTAALVSVRTLGAGGTTAATITGQLATAIVIDRLGLLGLSQRPLSVARVAGVALLAAGVFLIVRD